MIFITLLCINDSCCITLTYKLISADPMSHDDNVIAQMDQISKDIASKSPLVSEPEPVENLKSEYTQNEGFLAKIEVNWIIF